MTDEAAVRGFCDGDDVAFEWLATRYTRQAQWVARMIVRSSADAEDIVQDALIRAWLQRRRFARGKPFWPWLVRIVRNRSVDLLRQRNRAADASFEIALRSAQSQTPHDVMSAEFVCSRILIAMAALPPKQRGVARLSMLHGLSHRQVARRLSLREGTVRSHLTLARKRLFAVAAQEPVR